VTPDPNTPVTPAKHDPSKFIPSDHSGKQSTASGNAVVPVEKKSDDTMVYLISGIGALIFVVLVGLYLC
jgi:hypothetical protein